MASAKVVKAVATGAILLLLAVHASAQCSSVYDYGFQSWDDANHQCQRYASETCCELANSGCIHSRLLQGNAECGSLNNFKDSTYTQRNEHTSGCCGNK